MSTAVDKISPIMPEKGEGAAQRESKLLKDRLGKNTLRWVAAMGLLAGTALGISGKPNAGISAGVEVTNPISGDPVTVGVNIESVEDSSPGWGLGLPDAIVEMLKDQQVFQLQVGGSRLNLFVGSGRDQAGFPRLVIYAGADTTKTLTNRISRVSAVE